jgi:diguanylate cyclase (GGDEF)-like protein/PAS domain S-box-containing protein
VHDYRRRVAIFSNRDAARALGYTEEQVRELGPRFAEHIAHPDDAEIVARGFADLATLADGAVIELITRVRHASGQWRWVVRRETVLSRYPDGSPREIGGNAFDITELKEAELRLEALARTDSLTGLANVRVIKERLTVMLAECGRGRRVGLLMLDIDNFKHLNDSYGHGAGDAALREVGRILRSNIRATDLAGRYGGEEFCVLLADVDEPSALLVADKLRRALHTIQLPAPVTASFGVTLLSAADHTIEESLERADRALYAAKKNGRDRVELGAPPPVRTIRWRPPTNPE